jgi:hypothetical protein
MRIAFIGLFLLAHCSFFAQSQLPRTEIDLRFLHQAWDARWITHPTASTKDFGVFHFRKTIQLVDKPEKCIVHVTGDNRYRLYINGQMVCFGPARSDVMHWNYETIDIAPYLQAGKNSIAAVVWNFGANRPVPQQSWETAFLLQPNDSAFLALKTDKTWKIYLNPSYSPEMEGIYNMHSYLVSGPGERIDAEKYPWGWENVDFNDDNWSNAKPIWPGMPRTSGTEIKWGLEPRQIPFMESTVTRLGSIRQQEGITVDTAFLSGNKTLLIPAKTKVRILFDQNYLTTAYPQLSTSGGKDSKITLTYAEALMEEKGYMVKKNRNELDNKVIKGYQDIFLSDGGDNRLFSPLWFRTYRYIEMIVETQATPLVINNFYGLFTGYPFVEKGSFSSSDPSLTAIWNTGWRTARLCAGETYYDCPYYEQLQYVGDTRIQALISLYVSGDDRLARKAINDFGNSLNFEGLTQSRYPAGTPQMIPTYSLFWVNMLYDFHMHRQDPAFEKQWLSGASTVLDWFLAKRNPKTGLIEDPGYWNFVDWCFDNGVPDLKGGSSVLSFQLAYTLRDAAVLFAAHGDLRRATHYRTLAAQIIAQVNEQCWSVERKMYADTPAKKSYSQHANILAVLIDALPVLDQPSLLKRIMTDTGVVEATFYFKFYLFQAMKKTGLGDGYLTQLKPWHDMLALGLTTFAENPEPTRSDCHAWSASPNYDLLATVCGIRPGSAGYSSVWIEPSLGTLQTVNGKAAHPNGMIAVEFRRIGTSGLDAQINLPKGLGGVLVWNKKKFSLVGGPQRITIK